MARTTLEVFALVSAGFALITSLIGRRLNPSLAGKRSSLAGTLVSLAIIIGVAPGLFLPKVLWVRGLASASSIALSLTSIVIVIQSSRAPTSSRSEPSSPAI